MLEWVGGKMIVLCDVVERMKEEGGWVVIFGMLKVNKVWKKDNGMC